MSSTPRKRVAVLFLAAGYGTRLTRDLEGSTTHSHLLGIPKPLLPVHNGRTIIDLWLDLFDSVENFNPLTDSYVICNDLHYDKFKEWGTLRFGDRNNTVTKQGGTWVETNLVSDGTSNNESRLGSCTCIALAIKQFNLQLNDNTTDVVVIAGDTLFLADFDLHSFISDAKSSLIAESVVATYRVPDAETTKVGIIKLTPDNFVVELVEKPKPQDTPSRHACPCFYYFKAEMLHLVLQYVEENVGFGLEAVDASGKLVAWLVKKCKVLAVPVSGRLDIGGLGSLIEAEEYLAKTFK